MVTAQIRMFSPSKKNEKKTQKNRHCRGVLLENVYTLSFCFCWYLPRKLWNCCFVWPHPLWEADNKTHIRPCRTDNTLNYTLYCTLYHTMYYT